MAASAAQVLANRENAQLSTGPTSPEGKEKAKMNALRSGLTARGFIIPLGMETAFAELESELQMSLTPVGGLEETLYTRILECAWNLHRCRIAQTKLFETAADLSIDPFLDDQIEAKHARIAKYARQYENSMLKMMKELGRLQTEVQVRNQLCPLTDEIIDDPEKFEETPQYRSAACDYTKVAKANKHRLRGIAHLYAPQNEAPPTREQEFFALLDRLTAPPRGIASAFPASADGDFQNEAAAAA